MNPQYDLDSVYKGTDDPHYKETVVLARQAQKYFIGQVLKMSGNSVDKFISLFPENRHVKLWSVNVQEKTKLNVTLFKDLKTIEVYGGLDNDMVSGLNYSIGGGASTKRGDIKIYVTINANIKPNQISHLLKKDMSKLLIHELTHFWKTHNQENYKGVSPSQRRKWSLSVDEEDVINYILSQNEIEAFFSEIRQSFTSNRKKDDQMFLLTDIQEFINNYVNPVYQQYIGNPMSQEQKDKMTGFFIDFAKERYPELAQKTGLFEVEPYQKKVISKHKAMKFKLIGKGGNKHKDSGMQKPSYNRGKSAPPIGENVIRDVTFRVDDNPMGIVMYMDYNGKTIFEFDIYEKYEFEIEDHCKESKVYQQHEGFTAYILNSAIGIDSSYKGQGLGTHAYVYACQWLAENKQGFLISGICDFGGVTSPDAEKLWSRSWGAEITKDNIAAAHKSLLSKNLQEHQEHFNLETFKVKDNLYPKFWDKHSRLDQEIRKKLKKIAKDFIATWSEEVDIDDVTITGSLANYTWSDFSDIDLHVILDMKSMGDKYTLIRDYFNSKRKEWNTAHNILINQHEVEIYVQDIAEVHSSTGVYSLLDDRWLVEPNPNKPTFNEKQVYRKASDLTDDINRAVKMYEDEQYDAAHEEATRLFKKFTKFRKIGLQQSGEFSIENLAYKAVRRGGFLDRLADIRDESYDASAGNDEPAKRDY